MRAWLPVVGFLGFVLSGIAAWLFSALVLLAPWLTSLGLVQWASVIVSLVGMGIAVFWIWILLIIIGTAILAAILDES